MTSLKRIILYHLVSSGTQARVGTTDEQIDLIKCPAGLEIGAETMSEIALSVMAEIVQICRGQTVQVELSTDAIDPICGMTVDTRTAKYNSVVEGKTIYFCCLRCKETFDRPHRAARQDRAAARCNR